MKLPLEPALVVLYMFLLIYIIRQSFLEYLLDLLSQQRSEEGGVRSLPRPSTDGEIWVPDHLTPSWVCLPNGQPVLTTIQPGESALCALEAICKVLQLIVMNIS